MIRTIILFTGVFLIVAGGGLAWVELRAYQRSAVSLSDIAMTGVARGWSPALSFRARRAQLMRCADDLGDVMITFIPASIRTQIARDCLKLASHSNRLAPSWGLSHLVVAHQQSALGDPMTARAALNRAYVSAPNEYTLALRRLRLGLANYEEGDADPYEGAASDMRLIAWHEPDQIAALYARHPVGHLWIQAQLANGSDRLPNEPAAE